MKKILIGDSAFEKLTSGIASISPIVASLYGPGKRTVLSRLAGKPVASTYFTGVLDKVSSPDVFENVGIQVFRDVINQVREKSGSGAGIAAVLSAALIRAGRQLIVGGISQRQLVSMLDSMQVALTKHIEDTSAAVAKCITGREAEAYAGVARTVTGDTEISSLMADVFKHVGVYGNVEMRRGHSTKHSVEYVDGYTFKTACHAYKLMRGAKKLELENPMVYVVEAAVTYSQELINVLVACNKASRPLLLVCDSVDTKAVELLLHNVTTGALTALVVKPPTFGYDRSLDLKDLAKLTGATVVDKDNPYLKLAPELAGTALRAVFNGTALTLVHDGTRLDEAYIAAISAEGTAGKDLMQQKKIKERIGNVRGKSAIVTIGGTSETTRDEAYYRAECAAHAIRGAMQHGVLAGGCQVFYDFIRQSPDAAKLPEALRVAVELPFAAVLGGRYVRRPISDFVSPAVDSGYDYMEDRIRNILESGIVDSAFATRVAAESAISIAKTVLSSGAVVVEG